MPSLNLNGVLREFESLPSHIEPLIAQLNLSPKGLVVEINGQIFRESEFKNAKISDGDTVELVQFMGGGQYLCAPRGGCAKILKNSVLRLFDAFYMRKKFNKVVTIV